MLVFSHNVALPCKWLCWAPLGVPVTDYGHRRRCEGYHAMEFPQSRSYSSKPYILPLHGLFIYLCFPVLRMGCYVRHAIALYFCVLRLDTWSIGPFSILVALLVSAQVEISSKGSSSVCNVFACEVDIVHQCHVFPLPLNGWFWSASSVHCQDLSNAYWLSIFFYLLCTWYRLSYARIQILEEYERQAGSSWSNTTTDNKETVPWLQEALLKYQVRFFRSGLSAVSLQISRHC